VRGWSGGDVGNSGYVDRVVLWCEDGWRREEHERDMIWCEATWFILYNCVWIGFDRKYSEC
jgi:hypothetical protein